MEEGERVERERMEIRLGEGERVELLTGERERMGMGGRIGMRVRVEGIGERVEGIGGEEGMERGMDIGVER